jgi:hypothetical protein
MSALSFAEGVAGAIERASPGAYYLMGDENWSYEHYYNQLLAALGSDKRVAVRDKPHPSLPDEFLYAGRGATIAYEPDPAMVALLGYRRGDLKRTIAEAAAYYAGEATRR